MRKPLERYLEVAAGVTGVTAQTAERFVQRLVKEGEVAADRAERIVADLLALSQRNREMVAELVRTEVDRAVKRISPPASVDVDELADRVVQRLRAEGMVLTTPGDEPPAAATSPEPGSSKPAARRTAGAKRTAAGTRTSAAAKRAAAAAQEEDGAEGSTGDTPPARPKRTTRKTT